MSGSGEGWPLANADGEARDGRLGRDDKAQPAWKTRDGWTGSQVEGRQPEPDGEGHASKWACARCSSLVSPAVAALCLLGAPCSGGRQAGLLLLLRRVTAALWLLLLRCGVSQHVSVVIFPEAGDKPMG